MTITIEHHPHGDGLTAAREFWTRGNNSLLQEVPGAIAITGSRAATAYGTAVAHEYADALTHRGHHVITGAAFGIEQAAVRGVLAAGGAPIVVLPGGIDRPYPIAHTDLLEAVVTAGGLLISLAEPGTVVTRAAFIVRAAWTGAQSAGTLIVEAAQRSGALTVAQAATLTGRHVGAVPGPVTSVASHGCNQLLAHGAQVVYDHSSLLEFATGRRLSRGH